MKRITAVLFAAVVALSLILRTYGITHVPPSLTWDEVSIGYNAYSILKTGRDEHGRVLPLDTFVAYGDYKPPLAVYATVPFVALFGLNGLSVRLPSALFGTATVALMFYLVRTLLASRPDKRTDAAAKKRQPVITGLSRNPDALGLLASLFLAVSPWHVNISRAGFEANIALFFVVLGVYLILRAESFPRRWATAFLPFVAAIYTFNSARYAVIILGAGLLLMRWKAVKAQWKQVAVGALIALAALGPIIPHLLSKEARLRFQEVNIFSDAGIVSLSNDRIASSGNAWWANIFYNRRVAYVRSFAMHFLDHFEPWYLFVKGDGNPKFSIQDVGQMYMADIPLVAVGLVVLFSSYPQAGWILALWMLSAILPAAVARETPHALRTLNAVPVWMTILAIGAAALIDRFIAAACELRRIPARTAGIAVVALIAGIYSFNVGYYLHNYYRHYPVEYSHEWEYGYADAVRYASGVSGSYDRIFMTDLIGRPYMYTLFYLTYDPATYLREKKSYFDAAGFYHVTAFGKYRFPEGKIEASESGSLYILPASDVPEGVKPVNVVHLLDGRPILSVVDRK